MNNNFSLPQIINWLRVSIISEFKKLIWQRTAFLFFLFFLVSEFIILAGLLFYHYRISPVTDAAPILEKFHYFFFNLLLSLIIIFSGSQQICREYETGVIKNIALTGIPIASYLFARLITFIFITLACLLVAYLAGIIFSLVFFGGSLSLSLLIKDFLFNSLNLVYAYFIMLLAASLIKDTRKSIQLLLIYYIGFEQFLTGGIINLQSFFNIPGTIVTLARHSPVRTLELIENSMGTSDLFFNLSLLIAFLLSYSSVILFKSLDYQLGLLKK